MSKLTSLLILFAALLTPAAAHAKRAAKPAPAPVTPAFDEPQAAPAAPATPSPPEPASVVAVTPEPSAADVRKRFGVGYKIGNGLGFVGGDVIVNVVDHLTIDAQANWDSESVGPGLTASGYGLAAEAQLFLHAGQVSSPYVGAGLAYAHMSVADAAASGTGVFANVGYEFRWRNGLGILVGAGAGYLASLSAMSPTASFSTSGGAYFNLEAGVRYMIF